MCSAAGRIRPTSRRDVARLADGAVRDACAPRFRRTRARDPPGAPGAARGAGGAGSSVGGGSHLRQQPHRSHWRAAARRGRGGPWLGGGRHPCPRPPLPRSRSQRCFTYLGRLPCDRRISGPGHPARNVGRRNHGQPGRILVGLTGSIAGERPTAREACNNSRSRPIQPAEARGLADCDSRQCGGTRSSGRCRPSSRLRCALRSSLSRCLRLPSSLQHVDACTGRGVDRPSPRDSRGISRAYFPPTSNRVEIPISGHKSCSSRAIHRNGCLIPLFGSGI